MKKILVTGSNGQLGRAINKEYSEDNITLLNTDVSELDITNIDEVLSFVLSEKPDVIINCAAHTGVDACETQWDLAYKINAIGPRNLSIAATKIGAKMIHVSTDYVFDGIASEPYKEFDRVDPQGAYGKTKLEGEKFVAQFSKDYFIIRTAWLYGDGNNFVKTMLRLSNTNEEIKVVGDQVGSPTSAKELAKMIHFLEPTNNYGLFHGTCEGQCSWAEFASEIFKLANKSTIVKAITSAEYPTPVKRPAYSVLDNYMLKLTTNYEFANWKEALVEYLNEINK